MLREQNLSKLGFRFGLNGPHAARTMMLDDLRLLLAHTPATASRAEYAEAIIGANVLGKATKKARELALRHLSSSSCAGALCCTKARTLCGPG